MILVEYVPFGQPPTNPPETLNDRCPGGPVDDPDRTKVLLSLVEGQFHLAPDSVVNALRARGPIDYQVAVLRFDYGASSTGTALQIAKAFFWANIVENSVAVSADRASVFRDDDAPQCAADHVVRWVEFGT